MTLTRQERHKIMCINDAVKNKQKKQNRSAKVRKERYDSNENQLLRLIEWETTRSIDDKI